MTPKKKQTFETTLDLAGKTATGFRVPPEVVDALGPGKRIPVRVTIGRHMYRSTITPMGGEFLVGVSAVNREAAGLQAGQRIRVSLERDEELRTVDVPKDLAQALKKSAKATATFDSLSFTHKREYVEWITGAKKAETRERRLIKAVEMLTRGQREPR